MIVVVICLLLINYNRSLVLPAICGTIALLLFIAYSLWIWIKKPGSIVINNRLSDANGVYILYFLVVSAFQPINEWWYITPIASSVVLLFISLIYDTDEKFDI